MIDNINFKVTSTNREADKLEAEGFEFRSHILDARESLDKGAIAFCIFIGYEFANIGWVALSEEAKKSFWQFPVQVDFSNKQAYMWGAITPTKHRGKGLNTYGVFKRLQFLHETGILSARGVIAKSMIASHRVHAKFKPKIYAEARCFTIFGWKLWKEKPL